MEELNLIIDKTNISTSQRPLCSRCKIIHSDSEYITKFGKVSQTCPVIREQGRKHAKKSSAKYKSMLPSKEIPPLLIGQKYCRSRKCKSKGLLDKEIHFRSKVGKETPHCLECRIEYQKKQSESKIERLSQPIPLNHKRCSGCNGNPVPIENFENGNNICKKHKDKIQQEIQKRKEERILLRSSVVVKEGEKLCLSCNKSKPLLEFYSHKGKINKCFCVICVIEIGWTVDRSIKSEEDIVCRKCKIPQHSDQYLHVFYNTSTTRCLTCRKNKNKFYYNRMDKQIEIANNDSSLRYCVACNTSVSIDLFEKNSFDHLKHNLVVSCIPCRNQRHKSKQLHYKKFKKQYQELNKNVEFGFKHCFICLEKKSIDKYDSKTITKSNEFVEVNSCIDCRNYYSNFRFIHQYYIDLKQTSGSCVDCGESNWILLEFDHIPEKGIKSKCVRACTTKSEMDLEVSKTVMRCKKCHRKRTHDIYKNYRLKNNINLNDHKQYIDDLKVQMGGCQKCNWLDINNLEALEFDHIEMSTKDYNISELVKKKVSFDIIDNEIEKCRLLCVDCHFLRTIKQCNYYNNPRINY